jgi:hypothetical protein
MLSSLSTPVNPNDFKWMQDATLAKKPDFPTQCLKTGAIPVLGEKMQRPLPRRTQRVAEESLALPTPGRGDGAFMPGQFSVRHLQKRRTFPSALPCPPSSASTHFQSNTSPQAQPNPIDPPRPCCRACQHEPTPMVSNGCEIRPRQKNTISQTTAPKQVQNVLSPGADLDRRGGDGPGLFSTRARMRRVRRGPRANGSSPGVALHARAKLRRRTCPCQRCGILEARGLGRVVRTSETEFGEELCEGAGVGLGS